MIYTTTIEEVRALFRIAKGQKPDPIVNTFFPEEIREDLIDEWIELWRSQGYEANRTSEFSAVVYGVSPSGRMIQDAIYFLNGPAKKWRRKL